MLRFLLLLLLAVVLVVAQSPSGVATPQPTTPTVSLSLTTGSATITVATTLNGRPAQVTTIVPGIVSNVTYTITPTSTPSATSNATSAAATSTPTPDPYVLATKVDPAFAVLGVILILTGLPSAFWGHKNRWTSFFLIGFYTLSLVCIVLIFKFGVLPAIHPPTAAVRGMFVLASFIAGVAGGGIAIFFWKGARYGIGAWGGFAFALWLQCFRNGGLIRPIGFRWILYIGCGVIGFTLATIPKIHYHILLISTAIVGASSFILGVDCFTTAGLKEFYIWNLGFPGLFPKFSEHGIQFPVTQQMQIELGLIGAVALMGMAVQLRILKVLQRKMKEITEETKHKDEEAELKAAERMGDVDKERGAWEKEHSGFGRNESNLSSVPLLKHSEDSSSPILQDDDGRRRNVSGLSDFKAAPTSEDDLKRASRHTQQPGALPALDLGLGLGKEVPANYIARDVKVTAADVEELRRKQELLAEIQTLRRSIDVLKTETPAPSSSEHSRRPSVISGRTLSMDASNSLHPNPHARPPRATDPRARVHSMELSSIAHHDPISRPTSVPLKDEDWDKYIQERKLLQPPAGITPPIMAAPVSSAPRVPIAPAVQEALQLRKQRESVLAGSSESSEDVPLVRFVKTQQRANNNTPVNILPPRRASGTIAAPVPAAPVRTRTFEELNERHREKMRDLQAPLTQAEKEQADLVAARQRWERSKALEKEAVTRRQAEKAATLERRKKSGSPEVDQFHHSKRPSQEARRHSRSLSADKLGGGSKRVSMMKVEDWQRYQQDTEGGVSQAAGSKRDSRAMRSEGAAVPFPPETRRKSRDILS